MGRGKRREREGVCGGGGLSGGDPGHDTSVTAGLAPSEPPLLQQYQVPGRPWKLARRWEWKPLKNSLAGSESATSKGTGLSKLRCVLGSKPASVYGMVLL